MSQVTVAAVAYLLIARKTRKKETSMVEEKTVYWQSHSSAIFHRIYMHIRNMILKNNHIFHKHSLMPSTIIKVISEECKNDN